MYEDDDFDFDGSLVDLPSPWVWAIMIVSGLMIWTVIGGVAVGVVRLVRWLV